MVDIVHEMIERAKLRIAESFGLPEEVADLLNLIEHEIKREYGGAQMVVHRPRADTAAKVDKVRADYLSNVPVEEISSRHGISRATLYRYLKRR
jgi:transcriptional regulator of acetoin/glycerol metabolism